MSATWKNNLELTIFGESHGKAIGITIGNLPSGIELDLDFISSQMKRRSPGNNALSTPRKEKDEFEIISGIKDNYTTGAPLTCLIYNTNTSSKDYSELESLMRPSHSDYPAYIRYDGYNDVRGSGHFSGRITAPIVFGGAIAMQILKEKRIEVVSHIKSIKDVNDDMFDTLINDELVKNLQNQRFPLINKNVEEEMVKTIEDARDNNDSVGGSIECAILNVPAGIGNPFFDSIESHMSSLLFSIPAVKSVSFGNENIDKLFGSQANDLLYYDDLKEVKTKTNNSGGINGGISNGMPIVFNVTFKPTASIFKTQETIDVTTETNTTLTLTGRHDPCIVIRALPVVESMAALTILDFLL